MGYGDCKVVGVQRSRLLSNNWMHVSIRITKFCTLQSWVIVDHRLSVIGAAKNPNTLGFYVQFETPILRRRLRTGIITFQDQTLRIYYNNMVVAFANTVRLSHGSSRRPKPCRNLFSCLTTIWTSFLHRRQHEVLWATLSRSGWASDGPSSPDRRDGCLC